MTIQNSKTIISYNGGSAGDLFVLSCNNELLNQMRYCRVVQPATLKTYEHKIRMGEPANLDFELSQLPHDFVNTHLLDEVVDRGYTVYNVVINNPEIQLKTIYRQMQIQKLSIKIHTDIWYTTIRDYSLSNDFISAAEHWFIKAKELWLERMNYRLSFDKAIKLSFDSLYSTDFVDDLVSQGWNHNIQLLRDNHVKWLEENSNFSYEKTINIMAEKLSTMDWTKREGWVEYIPK